MNRIASRLTALIGLLTVEILVGAVVFLAAFALFFYMTRVVFVQHSQAFDLWAFGVLDELQRTAPAVDGPAKFVTFFASAWFLVPAALIGPFVLWRTHFRREAVELFGAIAGGALLNQLLKMYFHRPRPANKLLHVYGLSFPSGHSMLAVAFYGGLAWLLARHFGRPGWAVPLLLWALLIGLSRIYLHAHYATDVLAGFAGGAAWLLLLRAGMHVFWREEKDIMEA